MVTLVTCEARQSLPVIFTPLHSWLRSRLQIQQRRQLRNWLYSCRRGAFSKLEICRCLKICERRALAQTVNDENCALLTQVNDMHENILVVQSIKGQELIAHRKCHDLEMIQTNILVQCHPS
jgi:hypothetical protein